MKVEDYKILEADFVGKGVSAQPNPMEKPEDEAKAVFDELVKDVVTPKFNALVDAMGDELGRKQDTEEGRGLSDNNYTNEEKAKLQEAVAAKHEHANKELLDGISQTDINNWNGGNVLTKNNTAAYTPTGQYHPATKKYVDDKVVAVGAADMTMAVYDPRGKKKDIFAHEERTDNPHGVTAEQIGAATKGYVDNAIGSIPTPDVSGQIGAHNTSADAHSGMFAPMYTYGTTGLEAGTSSLESGKLYLEYE